MEKQNGLLKEEKRGLEAQIEKLKKENEELNRKLNEDLQQANSQPDDLLETCGMFRAKHFSNKYFRAQYAAH